MLHSFLRCIRTTRYAIAAGLLSPAALNAQNGTFQKIYLADINSIDGTATFNPSNTLPLASPVYCFSAQVATPGKYDIVLLRLDSAGNTMAHRMLTGNPMFHDWATGFTDLDGRYYLTGSSRAFDTSAASNESSYVLAFDNALSVLKHTNYFLPGREMFAKAVASTAAGDLLVTGVVSFNASWSFFLMKTDTAGNVLWFKQYALGVNAVAVHESPSGDILVAGSYADGFQRIQPVAFRFDASGNPKWGMNYIYATGPFDYQNSVLEYIHDFGNGSTLLAGRTDFSGAASLGGMDAYALLVDDAGTIKWAKTFGEFQADWPYGFILSPNGHLVISGGTGSFFNFSNFGFVQRIDTTGTILASLAFGDTTKQQQIALSDHRTTGFGRNQVAGHTVSAGIFNFFVADYLASPGGGCAVNPVVFQSKDASGYPAQPFAAGVDTSVVPYINHVPFSSYTGFGDSVLCSSPTGVGEIDGEMPFFFFAGPAAGESITVYASATVDELALYDSQGRQVIALRPHARSVVLAAPAPGLYIVHATMGSRVVVKKMMVAR